MKKYALILAAMSLALAWLNFTPGTMLSGWDTLQPELNLPLYIGRIFWGVWQQHQGLGAVASQAHAVELARLWYLLPATIILPENLVRWGFFGLMLVLGPLGTYFFLNKIVRKEAAFAGGLFYLLNLGTMQHFYLPLEMFATGFAFLPWLFWAALNYLERGRSRDLLILILIFLLSAPMAHTPTLWFVNFGALVLFAVVLAVAKVTPWRKVGQIFIIGLVANAFWLLPSLYFIFNHAGDVAVSHISQQFTPRAVATNREFADFADVALIRGYLFDWGHFDFVSRQFVDLFPVWKAHLSQWFVSAIGYGAFVMAIAGVIITIWRREKKALAFLPVLVLALGGLIFGPSLNLGSIFDEALRFPFTKFSLLLMLALAFYFGLAIEFLLKRAGQRQVIILITVLLMIYLWPAFNGNLICGCERVQIPAEYQQVFNYFASRDPSGRIAPFPVDTMYGWGYYSWGYEGAGFRWFGLPQALLDREFDRWMSPNENYYWEISQAVYSKNLPLFESVLNKYRINWLLVDGNIINPSSPKALYTDELEQMMAKSGIISKVREFGKISVYQVQLKTPTKSFISLAQNLPNIEPAYKWGNLDQAYFDNGDYMTIDDRKSKMVVEDGGSKAESLVYPYRTLFSGKSQADLEFDPAKIPLGELIKPEDYHNLSHRDGYLIKITAKNLSGMPFLFWVEDLNSRRADLETYLPAGRQVYQSYFVLPPMEFDGLGYTFHLDNQTFGGETAQNELEGMEVYRINYWDLVQERQEKDLNAKRYTLNTSSFAVEHPNPAWYRIDLPVSSNWQPETIILAQSFEPGWIGFSVGNMGELGGLGKHILVNNWANGWQLSGNERIIYLFFWPQALEFVGLGVLGVFLAGIVFSGLRTGSRRPAAHQ
ncbi:hypothetical protein M1403_03305 [Patescibacteria group bacterium]|nr:hypothetical protein [Patescibacteria group bacterium]